MKKIVNVIWEMIKQVSYWILKFYCKMLGKEMTDARVEAFNQFVKFGLVGVSNTIISYVIYVVVLLALQNRRIFAKNDYLIAQGISFFLSVLWSFYWNNKMVFVVEEGKKRSLWRTIVKTYISYSFTGLFLNSALLFLWIKYLKVSELVAPIINLLISVPLNYIINKFWAFETK